MNKQINIDYRSKLHAIEFTPFEIDEINQSIKYFVTIGKWHRLIQEHIMRLKECNVSFSRLTIRLEKILALGKDSSSKKAHLYRYGLKEGSRRFKKKTASCIIGTDYYVDKYGEEEAKKIMSAGGASLDNYVNRHGVILGTIKWNNYLIKRAASYKKKRDDGYVYAKHDFAFFVERYGVIIGTIVYNTKIEAQRYKVSKQRYIDDYGEEEGAIICRKIKDHCSLEYMVEKYGPIEGLEQYVKRCNAAKGSVKDKLQLAYPDTFDEAYAAYLDKRFIPNLAGFQKKYGDVDGLLRYQDAMYNAACKRKRSSVSKISMELFNKVKLIIPELTEFGTHELVIKTTIDEYLQYNRTAIRLDCFYNNRVIEFNGDCFHANPAVYNANDNPHPYLPELTSQDIWDNDAERHAIITSRGYEVKYVWGLDYANNRANIIKECVEWLLNN